MGVEWNNARGEKPQKFRNWRAFPLEFVESLGTLGGAWDVFAFICVSLRAGHPQTLAGVLVAMVQLNAITTFSLVARIFSTVLGTQRLWVDTKGARCSGIFVQNQIWGGDRDRSAHLGGHAQNGVD